MLVDILVIQWLFNVCNNTILIILIYFTNLYLNYLEKESES